MNTYQKDLIEEHSNLVVRIQKLHDFVYSGLFNNDTRIEFANKCIQLTAMKKYEEALRARIESTGITFENGNYFEKIASITSTIIPPINTTGSDYDVDEETKHQSDEETKHQSNEK